MSQDYLQLVEMINHLSQRDFVRLKLYVNEKFDKLKQENPKKINNIVYAVKNPERVKDSVNKYRRKVKNTTSNTEKNKDNSNKDNSPKLSCSVELDSVVVD